ncbi:hypothetical protein AURANDRAFT_67306 [Aureococcus anophagefferens]|uniref:Uncharacterized protein n=1 Tax=Aureococcus anophagefferens TaxID=44056 RepID=F0YKQ2_AURAN|nr:hypothetical protein AURANDRAFT_67306 [Aureococcus anophagefferens]EGB04321.1 hypothetical protein AURANDRAFT_67306 [Aureococcus anophagefferens]|eukprot:XP_009041031.1 hypothetical protein AURANDRAFT_67306 [Aureococcus anophagefferens]
MSTYASQTPDDDDNDDNSPASDQPDDINRLVAEINDLVKGLDEPTRDTIFLKGRKITEVAVNIWAKNEKERQDLHEIVEDQNKRIAELGKASVAKADTKATTASPTASQSLTVSPKKPQKKEKLCDCKNAKIKGMEHSRRSSKHCLYNPNNVAVANNTVIPVVSPVTSTDDKKPLTDGGQEEKKDDGDIPWIKDVDKDSIAYWYRYVDGKYEETYTDPDESKPDVEESDDETVLNDDTNVKKGETENIAKLTKGDKVVQLFDKKLVIGTVNEFYVDSDNDTMVKIKYENGEVEDKMTEMANELRTNFNIIEFYKKVTYEYNHGCLYVFWDETDDALDDFMEREYRLRNSLDKRSLMWIEKAKEVFKYKQNTEMYLFTKSKGGGHFFVCDWTDEKHAWNFGVKIDTEGYAEMGCAVNPYFLRIPAVRLSVNCLPCGKDRGNSAHSAFIMPEGGFVGSLAFTRFSDIRNVRPDSGRFAIIETVLAVIDINVGSIRYKLFHSTVFRILNKPLMSAFRRSKEVTSQPIFFATFPTLSEHHLGSRFFLLGFTWLKSATIMTQLARYVEGSYSQSHLKLFGAYVRNVEIRRDGPISLCNIRGEFTRSGFINFAERVWLYGPSKGLWQI